MAEEDDDIDSGWDLGEEEAPVTRAVDSRRLLAQFRKNVEAERERAPENEPAQATPLAITVAPPPMMMEGDPSSEPPTTRRASDDEMRLARAKATAGTIRLGGQRNAPAMTPPPPGRAPSLGVDARVHTRPTPPTGVKMASPPPAGPSATGAGSSLRLPSDSPRRVAAAQRRATVVNRAAAAPASEASVPPTRESAPPLDLHLDITDLAPPERETPVPGEAPIPAARPRPQAITRPSPKVSARADRGAAEPGSPQAAADPPGDAFDALPVDEMLATATSSRPPPPPAPSPAPSPPEAGSAAEQASPESEIELEDDVALSAEELAALEEDEDPELAPIRERFDRGDFFGAALRAEALLESRPDLEAAKRYRDSAHEALCQMYLARLGTGEQVLRVAMRPDEIQGLSLDHRSGFLISLIDGVATLDEVLDMSGMSQLDALRLLYEMREQGVVAVDSLRL